MVGRVAEQAELRSLLDEPESVFAAVYGRRRVGKTYLVRKTFGNDFAFDHVGMSSGKMSDQLESFRNSLIAHGHRKCPQLKGWISAFEELKKLLDRSKSAKKVVFIDELPWMDTSKSRFIPAFEHFWNSWAAWRTDIVLIICGSATSWLLNKRATFCFATGTKRAVHLTMVTTDGLAHNSYRNEIQKELTLDDLFAS